MTWSSLRQTAIQAILATVHQALQNWGMQLSIPKTEYLCYKTAQHCSDHLEPLQIAQHEIEQVSRFKYLSSMQTLDQSVRAKVSNKVACAANAWLKCPDCISARMMTATAEALNAHSQGDYAIHTLSANETWDFPKQQLHRLDVLQMKYLRKPAE